MRQLSPLAAALLLTACTVGPDYTPPEMPTPPAYATPLPETPPETPPAPSPAPSPANAATEAQGWWTGYGDARLNALAAAALAGNLDIAAAEARLAEARALVGVARADGGLTLDGAAGASGTHRLDGDRPGSQARTQGSAQAGLQAAWSPDLSGGQRRAVEAAEAAALEAALRRDDTVRQVIAEVVRRHLEILRDQARLSLIGSSLELQQKTLDLVRERFAAGLAAQLDVSRAEAQVAATRARRGPLLRDLAGNRAALAVLTGQTPSAPQPEQNAAPDETAAPSLPTYQNALLLGLPRDLLRDRPDVRAAEAALMAATADIGVAEADLYPQLSLPGSLTLAATGLGTGTVVNSLIAGLGAALDIPLFDSGARRARITAAEARAQEALLAYRAALLDAVAEVETALGELTAAQARRDDLDAAVTASTQAFQQAEALYTQGLVGFLDVLDAQRELLDNRQNLAAADTDVTLLIAELHTALGSPAAP